jgi:hypothetical protein
MANKDKILLLAMISMLVPGALPNAYADGGLKKSPKRTAEPTRANANRTKRDSKNDNDGATEQ